MRSARRPSPFLALGALALLTACSTTTTASTHVTLAGEEAAEGADGEGRDARSRYNVALAEFRDGNCLSAEPKFAAIRTEFRFTRFAPLAELRIADCKFEQKQYAEAIAGFREFIRFRPSHVEVVYARYRIAESYYAQIPADWFLVPPSWERDQGSTREALSQLRRFILDFPEDTRVPEARRMEQRCLALLAEHELYAAEFYRSRRAYRATIARVQTLLATYHGSGVEPRALLLLGRTFLDTREPERARQAFEELVASYPESEQAAAARDELRDL
ncbi:MAG: outer membrane protein assembly factor BamD [Polyangiales bacterium]|nr:outer membrane protein assembly factor BamD [Sandaracinaceae bacterium]